MPWFRRGSDVVSNETPPGCPHDGLDRVRHAQPVTDRSNPAPDSARAHAQPDGYRVCWQTLRDEGQDGQILGAEFERLVRCVAVLAHVSLDDNKLYTRPPCGE